MLVSKKSRELTPQQKSSLQILFGESTVLPALKQRLAESEQNAEALQDYLSEALNTAEALKNILMHCWKVVQACQYLSEEQLLMLEAQITTET